MGCAEAASVAPPLPRRGLCACKTLCGPAFVRRPSCLPFPFAGRGTTTIVWAVALCGPFCGQSCPVGHRAGASTPRGWHAPSIVWVAALFGPSPLIGVLEWL